MINNTLAIQKGTGKDASIRFVTGEKKDGKAQAFLTPADGKGWFWVQAAIRVGDKLYLFLPQIEKTKEAGAFGFKQTGQSLAIVENPDDEPEKWRMKQHKIPSVEFTKGRERCWGSALLKKGGDLYVYGYVDDRTRKHRSMTVARVPADKLIDFSSWRFHTAKGWSEKPEDAEPLADGLATEFSVSELPGGKGYVAIYTERGLSDRILGRFADAPEGPWSIPVLLYKCPEIATDKGVFSYAAKAHPWAVSGNELLVSYCVNTYEFSRLFKEDAVYRPKFVRIELTPGK